MAEDQPLDAEVEGSYVAPMPRVRRSNVPSGGGSGSVPGVVVRRPESEEELPEVEDPLAHANAIIRQREEVARQEAEARAALLAEKKRLLVQRDQVVARLDEIEQALSVLRGEPVRTETHPDVIREILRAHPEGLTSSQIIEKADYVDRKIPSNVLHPALHRMKTNGEIEAEGPHGETVYRLRVKKK